MKWIKCWFGFHDWENIDQNHKNCARCGKRRFVIHAIYEDDARKLGISESAIQRGYITKEDL